MSLLWVSTCYWTDEESEMGRKGTSSTEEAEAEREIPDKSGTNTQGVESSAEEQICVVQQHEQAHGFEGRRMSLRCKSRLVARRPESVMKCTRSRQAQSARFHVYSILSKTTGR